MNKTITMIGILFVIIMIGIIDIGINVFSLIPVIGDAIETIGETILELLQVLLAAGLVAIGVKD